LASIAVGGSGVLVDVAIAGSVDVTLAVGDKRLGVVDCDKSTFLNAQLLRKVEVIIKIIMIHNFRCCINWMSISNSFISVF
jgi:hypothetical protein